MTATGEASFIVDRTGEYFTLSGGQNVTLGSGFTSGRLTSISASFFFSPASELSQGDSWASDLAVIVIAPGMAPRQWGGADGLFPGATRVGDWSFQGAGSVEFDRTYSDVLLPGSENLTGEGTWQVAIMNALNRSFPVNYEDVRIVLEGVQDPHGLPDTAAPWESLLTLTSLVAVLGVARLCRIEG